MLPWLLAIRPKTLPIAVAPILIGSALCFRNSRFSWVYLCITLLAALLIQIGTNLANDYYDFLQGSDTSERIGPLRVTQAGLLAPRTVRLGFILSFTLAAFLGLPLVARAGWPILAIGLASVVSGILYTAGPFALAYLGLGEIFVLFFFGPISVAGTYYIQAGYLNHSAIGHGIAIGLLACAVLVVNNLRDQKQDEKANKKTLAVRFGARFARAEYRFCILIPALIELYWGVWPSSLLLVAGYFWLRRAPLERLLAQTVWLLLGFAIITSFYLV
ncbi:MAG: 1,4-dihydroxy-2-naphthoate polyprenyltransferase [Myxococcaceae bacterium]|nr:1,4-dihydroxy-2-naphthoate polyprenyltransferase [Myxococcaceae bacterium]MBH2006401.1 1,4-dihydroxy-2-naphthoate polyprenyltransferase [Myxococcaceae bacterium]